MSDFLRIIGPFTATSGYSKMTRAALRCALLAGYDVQAVESDGRLKFRRFNDGSGKFIKEPPQEPDFMDPLWPEQRDEVNKALATEVPLDAPTLLIQLPHNMAAHTEYVKGPRIGWAMNESDKLWHKWAACMRGVDSVLVPSTFCRDSFAAGGVQATVLPIPVDDRVYNPDHYVFCFSEYFRCERPAFLFYSVFSTCERKGWRPMMQAFLEEFADEDVGLIVKPSRAAEVGQMAGWCREGGAKIWLDADQRTEWEMASFFSGSNAYVGVGCEGYGLPFVEAGLCGKPSVALDKGGAADVVHAENGYPVPSTWVSCWGHMPHVYTRDQHFAQCSIEDLRKTMRVAVEDPDKKSKSAAAVASMQAYTPEALAPKFREVIESAIDFHECMGGPRVYWNAWDEEEKRPQTAIATGAWGDMFVSVGMALQKRDYARPLNFFHYGLDPAIADFLREQPFVNKVTHVTAPDKETYFRTFQRVSMSRFIHADDWQHEFAEKANCKPDDLLFTQVNQLEDQPVCRWHDAKLPDDIRAWAHTQHRCWGDYILLHPYSIQSARLSEHWPHWKEALRWLLDRTPHKYVLTGTEEMDLPKHPRLIDLVKRTPGMMHVLALCEKARGVISTCNAVAHWTVIQNIPGLIVANAVFNNEHDYYHRFVNTPPNTMIYQFETIGRFQTVATGWLSDRYECSANAETVSLDLPESFQPAIRHETVFAGGKD